MTSKPSFLLRRRTRAADWKCWRVTICLGVLASGGRQIICVTDEKVSFSGFSSDYMTIKNVPGIGGCTVLCAGDDAQYAPVILKSAKNSLKPNSHPQIVAEAVDDAYHEQVSKLIDRRVLKRFGFNCDSFLKSGKKQCTEALYARLCERIDKVNVSLQFLICGFDEKGDGHIFTAGSEGSVEGFDHVGLWAIGEGQPAALSTISFHVSHRHMSPPWSSLDGALALTLSAKFMAEAANSVGEGTFVVIFEKGKHPRFISEGAVNSLRKLWLNDGAPKISKKMGRAIPQLIFDPEEKPSNQSDTERLLDARIGEPGFAKRILRRKSVKSLLTSGDNKV